MGKHIRVDRVKAGQSDDGSKKEDDFSTTVFVGNLPFIVSEEEVHEHFSKFGTIQNVRLVRDPKTFIGKGIGFVMYATQDQMRAAIVGAVKFKGRELRLKKATDPKKREKKANRKEAALEQRREKRRLKQRNEDSDSDDLKNFGRKLQDVSDDSEDEGGKLPTMPKVVDLSSKDEVTKQMKALGKTTIEDRELKIQNVIAFNQRRRQNMLKEMIASAQGKGMAKKMTETAVHKKSFNENFKNEPVKFKEILGKRIEKKKKVNLAKINKIKIRTKKV